MPNWLDKTNIDGNIYDQSMSSFSAFMEDQRSIREIVGEELLKESVVTFIEAFEVFKE